MDFYKIYVTVQDKNGFAISKAKFVSEEELIRKVPELDEEALQNWPHIHVSVQ